MSKLSFRCIHQTVEIQTKSERGSQSTNRIESDQDKQKQVIKLQKKITKVYL